MEAEALHHIQVIHPIFDVKCKKQEFNNLDQKHTKHIHVVSKLDKLCVIRRA